MAFFTASQLHSFTVSQPHSFTVPVKLRIEILQPPWYEEDGRISQFHRLFLISASEVQKYRILVRHLGTDEVVP
jgi:hypothetical protein